MNDQDGKRQEEVGNGHERNNGLAELTDTLHAANHDQSGKGADDDSHDDRIDGKRSVPGLRDGIGLKGRQGEAKGENHTDSEDNSHPALSQALFHVVGRAAPEAAAFIPALKELCQGILDKAGSRAQKGDQPHPEHRPGSASHNSQRNPRHVTRSNTSSAGDAQRLERADGIRVLLLISLFLFLFLPPSAECQANHLAQVAKLHKFRFDRKVYAKPAGQDQKYIRPNNSICRIDDRLKNRHVLLLPLILYGSALFPLRHTKANRMPA